MNDKWSVLKQTFFSHDTFNTGIKVTSIRHTVPGPGLQVTRQSSWQRICHASQYPEFANHDFRDCFSILSPYLNASAILIARNAILTVNHFRKSNLHRSNFWQVSNTINISNKDRYTCQPTPFPLKILNEDLEVLILEKCIDDISLIDFASTQEIEQAKSGLIVGYGDDQHGVSGVKRELKVNIELSSVNNNSFLFNCNSKRHLIIKAPAIFQAGPNRIETDGINPRDSGSPLYINAGGKVKLAGIATRSLNNGQAGLFIRVDTYKNEIDKILARFKA